MKQKMIKSLLQTSGIALVLGMMVSCTEDLEVEAGTNPIIFTIDSDGLDERSGTTRGTQITSITNFGVSASVYEKDAVGGYTSAGCESVASQIDVMTVQCTDMACGPHSAVALSFAHRCVDIRFSAYNQQHEALTVNSVSIYGVKYTGTLTGSSWDLTGLPNSSSSHPFTLSMTTNVASEATVDLTGATNHFMMLPQTIAAGTDLFVISTTEDGDERTYIYTVPSGGFTWEMGKTYTYTLVLGNGNLSISAVSVENWDAVGFLTGMFSADDWTAQ